MHECQKVFTRFEAAFSISTQAMVSEMCISQPVLLSIVHEERMYPYFVQKGESFHTIFFPLQGRHCIVDDGVEE